MLNLQGDGQLGHPEFSLPDNAQAALEITKVYEIIEMTGKAALAGGQLVDKFGEHIHFAVDNVRAREFVDYVLESAKEAMVAGSTQVHSDAKDIMAAGTQHAKELLILGINEIIRATKDVMAAEANLKIKGMKELVLASSENLSGPLGKLVDCTVDMMNGLKIVSISMVFTWLLVVIAGVFVFFCWALGIGRWAVV